jgi:hypothetical protein
MPPNKALAVEELFDILAHCDDAAVVARSSTMCPRQMRSRNSSIGHHVSCSRPGK